METHTQVQQGGGLDLAMEASHSTSPGREMHNLLDDSVARSESNILRWMDYLPEDCIKKMIEMEWDITT